MKVSKAERATVCAQCERNVLSGFRAHSSIPKSVASVLFDLTTKSAKILMVERQRLLVGSLFSFCT